MSTALTPSKRLHDSKSTETNGKGKRQNTVGTNSPSQPLKSSPAAVVFRILCPAPKIGTVTGEGGAVISQIRQETGAKVIVEENIPGCDEQIIVISGSDEKTEVSIEQSKKDGDEEANVAEESDNTNDGNEKEEEKEGVPVEDSGTVKETSSMQKALLLVSEKMFEADPVTDGGDEENNKPSTFILRLLVLSSQVGCLLGKGGSVIKQMSAESGAQIRIPPRDRLPICSSVSDELVEITGEIDAVRKALQAVSKQLLENPPRDHDSFPANPSGTSSHSSGHSHPRPEAYLQRHSFSGRGKPYAVRPRDRHESVIQDQMKPMPDVLTFRLLCHNDRVGGVIGKGGTIIKILKQETGCDIKVMEGVSDSEDRVIVISGLAHPDDRISAPQDAVIRVQTRIAMAISNKEKAIIARLLVSSNQIGCLLGKGGAIMSEMRKSSGAYIRILGKDQIPNCASESEGVVQINGEFEVVKEALLQITTRLRHHFFQNLFPSMDPLSNPAFLDQVPPFPPYMGRKELSPPFHSFPNFDGMVGAPPHVSFPPHDDHPPFMHNIHRPGMPPHIAERKPWGPQGLVEGGGPMGMPDFAGPPQRRIAGFGGVSHPAIITSTTIEVIVPRTIVPVIYGEDGACLKQIRQISDAKITINEPKPGASETVIIISGTPEQTHAAQSLIQAFVMSERESS
ncbi:PREDICTED: KH domain-containing protein At4g18375-like [Populus euphratica]|uniref:KH domain-containing protein At4g18375-like n=1 Tax=Populus euphratica TaxID=75702 RepID=A0AAJ6TTW9_POPEU|nr:PREDICTED: KH domain-containing protein At4g18375-like [Populus euphratica]